MAEPVDHRGSVGPRHLYDVVAAAQFNILTWLGLREHHSLLDIGCGSLRAGRLFIPYLGTGNYFGLEPDRRLVDEGLRLELGSCVGDLKKPSFTYSADFEFGAFERTFDYLVAHSILSHTSPDQLSRCMQQARGVMHPESLFVATYVPGDADHVGSEWVYPGVATYTRATIARVASDAGLDTREMAWPHPTGQQWVVLWRSDGTAPDIDDAPADAYRDAAAHFRARVEWFEHQYAAQQAELEQLRQRPAARIERAVRRLVSRRGS